MNCGLLCCGSAAFLKRFLSKKSSAMLVWKVCGWNSKQVQCIYTTAKIWKHFEARYYKCIDIVFNQRDNVFPRQLVIRQSFSPRYKIFTSTLIQPTLFILSGISLVYQCMRVCKKEETTISKIPWKSINYLPFFAKLRMGGEGKKNTSFVIRSSIHCR